MRKFALLVLAVVFAWSSGAWGIPANNSNTFGLVAAYEFTGNADDVSGNGNNGVVNGATLATDRFGNPNAAYSFDGADDNVTIPYSSSFDFSQTKAISYGAWVWVGSLAGQHNVPLGQDSDSAYFAYAIDLYGGSHPQAGHVEAAIHQSNPNNWKIIVSPETMPLNSWHQIFVTADETDLRLYVDGQQVAEGSLDGVWNANTSGDDTIIGDWSPNTQSFDGLIDDVYIYNRALSPAEVHTLANVPEPNTALLLTLGLSALGMRRRHR